MQWISVSVAMSEKLGSSAMRIKQVCWFSFLQNKWSKFAGYRGLYSRSGKETKQPDYQKSSQMTGDIYVPV